MKKGIIKKVAKYTLAGMGALAVAGLVGVVTTLNMKKDLEAEKETLLDRYRITQEFKDEVDKQMAYYEEGYQLGILTKDQFDEKVDYLVTSEFVEEAIGRGPIIEYQQKLGEINEKIDNCENWGLTSCVGVVLSVGAVTASLHINTDDKERE